MAIAVDTPAPAAARSLAEQRSRFREGKAALMAHFSESRATAPAATRLVRALARHVDQTLLGEAARAAGRRCAGRGARRHGGHRQAAEEVAAGAAAGAPLPAVAKAGGGGLPADSVSTS